MLGKIFGFIGKWLGYLILGLIAIAIIKFFVTASDNPDSLEVSWGKKVDRYWYRLGGLKYSEKPPFYAPQENIRCVNVLSKERDALSSEQITINGFNDYLISESLKARALLIGGIFGGEEHRVKSVDSMDCESRHDLYFKNIDSREIKSY